MRLNMLNTVISFYICYVLRDLPLKRLLTVPRPKEVKEERMSYLLFYTVFSDIPKLNSLEMTKIFHLKQTKKTT